MRLLVAESAQWTFDEPEDVLRFDEAVREGPGDRGEELSVIDVVAGPFGWTPYAALARLERESGAPSARRLYVLASVLQGKGYAVELECAPAPDATVDAQLASYLRQCVAHKGPVRDVRWTDEEIQKRWQEFTPKELWKDLEKPIFTEHYVVFGNSSGGKLFAKHMEECYATIRKTYPFPDVPGRKLMPVFLFRTPDQYWAYFAAIAQTSLESARRSKGHAWRDYYATYYESPGDPVHIHEGTHQVFANRLHLTGGGSWFQEGVAQYICTKPADRTAAATAVKKGRGTPLAEFMVIPSLLMSPKEDVKGGSEAGDHYMQAALLIEFLRESDWGKAGFPEFMRRIGNTKPNDVEAIGAVVQRVYKTDLAGLEKAFVEYCKKR